MPPNLANFGAFPFWCSDALMAVTFRDASRGAFRVFGRFHLLRGRETTEFGPSNPTANSHSYVPPTTNATAPEIRGSFDKRKIAVEVLIAEVTANASFWNASLGA